MFRQELEPDSGMLFIFPESAQRSFWMKNTNIPLSIAYVNENNEILNIEDMTPHDTNGVRSQGKAKCAIETNRGRFGYTRKMYNSLCGESFITLENKYVRYISFLGERDVPVKSTLRKYDENGRSVKKSVLFLSGGHEIEFNPAFEI